MQLTTLPTTCHSSRIVCGETKHTLFAPSLDKLLLHPVLEHGSRVEEYSVLSSKLASATLVSTPLPPNEQMMVFFGGAVFTLTVAFSTTAFFLWSLGDRVLSGCENFLHKGCCPFLQQRIVPNPVLERTSPPLGAAMCSLRRVPVQPKKTQSSVSADPHEARNGGAPPVCGDWTLRWTCWARASRAAQPFRWISWWFCCIISVILSRWMAVSCDGVLAGAFFVFNANLN